MKAFETVVNGATLVLFLGAAYVLLQPGGAARVKAEEWLAQRAANKVVEDEWAAVADGHTLGDRGGKILVEFSDYECPFCRQLHGELKDIVEQAATPVALVYRHFPLRQHPNAHPAARAAVCADAVGMFPEMHVYLFETAEWMQHGDWRRVAQEVGLADIQSFLACLDEDETWEHVAKDVAMAERLAVSGTPTLILPNAILRGMVGREQILEMLQAPQ